MEFRSTIQTNKKTVITTSEDISQLLMNLWSLEDNLLELDDYAPPEELLKKQKPGTYINMGDFGLNVENDLIYIEEVSAEEFKKARNDILSSEIVGLDAEFTVCTRKYQQPKHCLLQIATNEKVFVFNVLKMKGKPGFEVYQKFVRDLLSNPEIVKVGHTIGNDLDKITGNQIFVIQSTMDIAKIFKSLYPEKRKSALTFICQDLFGKQLSKYEQLSDWESPKLKKTQIFYAGMDALVTLKSFEVLVEEVEKRKKMGKDFPVNF